MTIIDVRSKAEFDQGHIDGALWFDVDRIAAGEMPDLPKDEQIALYCRSGARSSTAAYLMQHFGFSNTTSGGGLGQMAACGYSVTK